MLYLGDWLRAVFLGGVAFLAVTICSKFLGA